MDPMANTAADQRFSEELAQIARAREDLSAFRPLYEKYYEGVYIFVYRRCGDAGDAPDIVSAVFEKAMLNIHKYEYRGYAFSAWLLRIAQNLLTDHFRRQSREQKIYVHDDGLADILEDVEEDNRTEEKLQAVIECLGNLPDNERDLVVMRYFEKRKYEELAEIAGMPLNNLRVKMHRIMEKIRKSMERRNFE